MEHINKSGAENNLCSKNQLFVYKIDGSYHRNADSELSHVHEGIL